MSSNSLCTSGSLFRSEHMKTATKNDDLSADRFGRAKRKKSSGALPELQNGGRGLLTERGAYWHISRSVQPTMRQLSVPLALIVHLRFGKR